jgi:uncharacterized membrane protein YhaH (DUF805 family)
MNKVRHRYFRFTGRTARISFIYMAAVPAIFGWVAYKTDVSGNRTMRRGGGEG